MSSEAPETLFGQVPPDGAVSVRLRLKIKRKGNPPAVVCKTITEEAVLSEIQQSTAWRTWLEWDNSGPLKPKEPYTCKATLTWLGSDGKDIDQAVEVELDYWPSGPAQSDCKRSRRPDGARELGKAYRTTAPALADMVSQVVEKSLGPVKEAMDLAKKHADIVEKLVEREAGRVDSAITEMAERAKSAGAKPAQTSGGLKGLVDLLSIAKEAKSLLN